MCVEGGGGGGGGGGGRGGRFWGGSRCRLAGYIVEEHLVHMDFLQV